jgi:DNA-binding XRE family transcriptional regulator
MHLAPLGNRPAQPNAARLKSPQPSRTERSAPLIGPLRQISPSLFIARRGAAVIALLVGTGGLANAAYITERNQRGYPFEHFELGMEHSAQPSVNLEVPTAAKNLARVKEVFEPSITELASLFEVSRQTIYNWQAGQPIAAENERRLEQLARAADILDEQGLAQKVSVLRRPISDGKNFFDLVRLGSQPDTIAHALVKAIQDEMAQRRRLEQRLANRKRKPVNIEEIGSPHLDESL